MWGRTPWNQRRHFPGDWRQLSVYFHQCYYLHWHQGKSHHRNATKTAQEVASAVWRATKGFAQDRSGAVFPRCLTTAVRYSEAPAAARRNSLSGASSRLPGPMAATAESCCALGPSQLHCRASLNHQSPHRRSVRSACESSRVPLTLAARRRPLEPGKGVLPEPSDCHRCLACFRPPAERPDCQRPQGYRTDPSRATEVPAAP
mmetsp:Transcript_4315/g.8875  ORF Transcript_4315/g.8875 Transcript_4315/m.8875 type:complete len:203 (+) Transcript_4315:487-1095(+)